MKLKVMSFNLRIDVASDGDHAWKYRVQAVTDIINRHDPLIVGTQEGLYPMLEEIRAHISGYDWIGNGRYGAHVEEHSAIFYKKDALIVEEQGQFWLSEHRTVPGSVGWDAAHPRICTWAHFRSKLESGVQFIVYNTHLDHAGQLARDNGVAMIWEEMLTRYKTNKLPFLLMGDFNSEPVNPVITFLRAKQEMLTDCYSVLDDYEGGTFHGYKGGNDCPRIDYIFVSSAIAASRMEVVTRQLNGVYPSDHYPVIAELEITI